MFGIFAVEYLTEEQSSFPMPSMLPFISMMRSRHE